MSLLLSTGLLLCSCTGVGQGGVDVRPIGQGLEFFGMAVVLFVPLVCVVAATAASKLLIPLLCLVAAIAAWVLLERFIK